MSLYLLALMVLKTVSPLGLPLSHYLANMGREVPEIKIPYGYSGFKNLDPKCYTFLETLLTGEKIWWGIFGSQYLLGSKIAVFL